MACRIAEVHCKGNPFRHEDRESAERNPGSPALGHKQTQERSSSNHGIGNLNGYKRGLASRLKHDRMSEDVRVFFDIIKSCGKQKDLQLCAKIHADIVDRRLLEEDISLGNALVSLYAKCGALHKAKELFDELPARNVVTWNGLIAAYTHFGRGHEALTCLAKMRAENLSPDKVTYISVLKACASVGAVDVGEEIHREVRRNGLLDRDMILGTALVDMYAKCGAITKAQEVLDKLPSRNVITWNALIAGYVQQGLHDRAFSCFTQLQEEGLCPSTSTFTCILQACGNAKAVSTGETVYKEIDRQGLLEKDIVLGNALVDMYVKFGMLARAHEIFRKLSTRDVATWTVLITGYAKEGHSNKALKCYADMQEDGLAPNEVTYLCVLKACGDLGATDKGQKIHAELERQGLLERDIMLGTTVVDMYAKCGELQKAQRVFDKLPLQNTVTWNALIFGYAQQGLGEEALRCFVEMQDKCLCPNLVTLLSIIKACGSIGAAEEGAELHTKLCNYGISDKDIMIGTALVDMYSNCGDIEKAQEVFNMLPAHNIASWTALICGYAQFGKVKMVLDCIDSMTKGGVAPDMVIFIVLLTACSHCGLVNEGQVYFRTMNAKYGIIPSLEHRLCMVDMFSRAGLLHKAVGLIENVPISECGLFWSTVMGACRKWVHLSFARWIMDHSVQFDQEFAAVYVSIGNVFAAAESVLHAS